MAEPVLVKEFAVAHAGLNFVNGADEFDLTESDMDSMVENFAALKRQVPVLFRGPHLMGPARADRPADGWVDALFRKGGDLMARVRLLGEAAVAVMGDRFRGVSIGAFRGKDPHGTPVGWILDHLLITNAPFFADLNIAASRQRAGEAVIYLSARKEAAMAEPTKDLTLAEAEAKHAAEIKAKDEEIIKLRSENLSLQEAVETQKKQLATIPPDEEKEQLALRVAALERKTEAQDIRELVMNGLRRGTLKASWCAKYNEGGDEGTLKWFKSSRFGGDMKLLKYQVEMAEPVIRLNQSFASGAPVEGAPAQPLSPEDKQWLRSHGIDTEKANIAGKARDLTEYRRLKAEQQKGA